MQPKHWGRKRDYSTALVFTLAAGVLLLFSYFVYMNAEERENGSFSSSGTSRVLNAARGMGLKDPHVVGGTPMFECGRGDSIFTSAYVEGTNVQGERVRVTVCCGPFEDFSKGCTIRF